MRRKVALPRVGFEPTRKRFLRPPPLPLGYRGRIHSALSRTRTCNNVTLNHAPLPDWATRATRPWTPEGFEPSFPGCRPGVLPLDDGPFDSLLLAQGGPMHSCRGKGSNLQPRPSESRALIRLSYRNQLHGSGRSRTCTNLILSQAPLPIGLLNRSTRFLCTGRESNPRVSA